MLISATSLFSGKPIDLNDALISFLLSASDNPRGYRIAIAGTALCGLLLLPVAFLFYRKLSLRNRPLALLGSLIFAPGPLSAISMVFFTHDIDDLHVHLAMAAYIFMTAGVLICLALEAHLIIRAGSFALVLPLAFLLGPLIFLVYLLFIPDFFTGKSLLRNTAFCEWALCAILAASISGLAMLLSRPTR